MEEGYGVYYDFIESHVTLLERHVEENTVEEEFFLEIVAVLKADSVKEMDYYQGALSGYGEAISTTIVSTETLSAFQKTDVQNQYTMIMDESISDLYTEFNQYIGEEQLFPFSVKAIYELGKVDEAVLLFDNGIEYASVEDVLPATSQELYNMGYANIQETAMQAQEAMAENDVQALAGAYSIYNAVAYMESYTSNASGCNIHSGCGAAVNTTKYNPAYTFYVGTDSDGDFYHTDCANFVSQALYAGGLPTDSTWYAGSTAWKRVSELCTYMTGKGYWSRIPYTNVAVGDILRFDPSEASHIVMITAFDGVSFRYSGHTNDKLNYAISLSSNNEYYRVTH